MQVHISATILFVTLNVVAVEAMVPITVYNQCSRSIELVDNNVVETVVPGGTTIRTLSQGFSGTLRNGVNFQATLAEFSVVDCFLMYDINIIPIGVIDSPDSCTSLEECKAVMGSTGYNTPMQISPAGCTTVTCLEDGCVDAYHFPADNTKAHKCTNPTSVMVTFCPGGSEGLSRPPPQQQPSAILPTFAASTAASTQSPAFAPTMEASPPIPSFETLPQLQTEASVLTQTKALAPAIDASKSNTTTLTETPTITPLTLADSKMKSCDGDYKTATALPKMESKTDTLVSMTATAGIAAGTASKATVAPTVDAPLASTDSKFKTDTTTTTSVSATQVVSPLWSKSNEENTQSANTQSSADDGTGASTYVGTGMGLMAVVAIVAVVVVPHKKKEDVDETEEKEVKQEDVITPVTQINVL
ncbi:unnamed protein product [Peronospora destructor]|uniref:Uncharacterized protein n=1 Tax=Peronospora destructor TaxID=86335 RepID=A0AAV0UXN2_9STRA|nr:unnamed protein product [Peronospora destructor]